VTWGDPLGTSRAVTRTAMDGPGRGGRRVASTRSPRAAVIGAVARARPGGVVFHCGIGRDRTGLVAIVALALAGVAPADIVADYALSAGRLPPLFARRGEPDQGPLIEAALARAGTSAAEAIVAALDAIDVEAALRRGGLGDSDLAAFRARLLLDPAA
jgi:protein-tyrosine phosphatase